MTSSYLWLDGKLIPWQQANVHIMTHTLHYGSGAFEGIRCYDTDHGPALFRLHDHIRRLVHSFSSFGVDVPWSHEQLEQAIIDTVKANNLTNCYVRPLLFFGDESLKISPRKLSIHAAIIAVPWETYLSKKGINVAITSVKRMHPETAPIHNKINGFYVNSIFAFHEALDRGFDEALLLDYNENIAEGSVANIFFIIDGALVTPLDTAILPGITRATIIAIANKLAIPVRQQNITVDMIQLATEAFFTGTASDITPIKKIETKEFNVGTDTITEQISSAYYTITHAQDTDYRSWLTFIPR